MLRELSLDEVAAATKLPVRIIQALESDDFAALQDRGYALLAARSYAAAIGLDPEETALRLEEELQVRAPEAKARPPALRRLRLPREPLVWVVIAVTLIAIAAVLLHPH